MGLKPTQWGGQLSTYPHCPLIYTATHAIRRGRNGNGLWSRLCTGISPIIVPWIIADFYSLEM